jgi:hypothetical protein
MMKPYTILFAIFALLILSCSGQAADDKPKLTAEEILSKHLEAIGGKAALEKFKTRVATGTVKKDSEPEAQMAIVSELPNKVSAVYVFQNFNWQLTYDGTAAFSRPQFPRSAVVIETKFQEMLSTGTMFNDISLFNLLAHSQLDGVKVEAKGIKKIKGREAHVIEAKRPKVTALRFYFDTQTFMWVRTDYGRVEIPPQMRAFTNAIESKDEQLAIDFYVETWDFKPVDGVTLPFKFEMVATAPILKNKTVGTITGTITGYQHNIPIDAKMFR